MKTFSRKNAQEVAKRWVGSLRLFGPFCGQTVWCSLVAISILFTARALAVEIKLPEETARLAESPLPGYPLAVASCATCHSADYVKMQPTSSRVYWKAAVTKMQKTFGAPIPDEMVEPIVDYLVKTYGNERSGGGPNSATKPAVLPKAKSTPAK